MARWHERTVEKPRVFIYAAPGVADYCLRQVELGLEEEAVPSELRTRPEENALVLAYEAAVASPLGTGVGVGKDGIAVHYKRLSRETPLFFIPRGELSSNESRRLGVNAARLVKGIPFQEEQSVSALLYHELSAAIAKAILKVLQESVEGKGGADHD